MTNFEYIKSMTEEDFFDFVFDLNLDQCNCPARNLCGDYKSCTDAFIAWLKQEK